MRRFKWIGRFSYRANITAYVGFYEGNPGTRQNAEGFLIATDAPNFYRKNCITNWFCEPFRRIEFPTDPNLTYYMHKGEVNPINRRIIKKEIIV